ncbi:hypothetical protein QK901_04270 [Streptococcus thermophilus]|uniref:hypothetical protein n=1 Tax=Streptococcus thermophilus TaxID=1308 RepID=UPI003A7FB0A3
MAIKTKFLGTHRHDGLILGIDEAINCFIEENPYIEVIDIKFQSNISVRKRW